MRPLRLDLEGFGTFRDPMTLDFSDSDYFALVGATGSGKTTIIDAVCFALYGSAPRWPRRNQVSLAMAPSTGHTRVSLVFENGGHRYAAIRVLARAARGQVTTKQSRLIELAPDSTIDGDLGDVLDAEIAALADSPEGMADAVESLLGLSWDHFIQCVVLPQGGFAKFLHAPKSERQDLLVSLLGLSVYSRVGQRANQVAKEAAIRAQTLAAEMAKYADATEEAEEAARRRADELTRLQSGLPQVLEPWLHADQAVATRVAETRALVELKGDLATVTPPSDLEQLASQRTAALAELAEAAAKTEAKETDEALAEANADEAGDAATWRELVELHGRAAALTTQLTASGKRLAAATKALGTAHESNSNAVAAEAAAAGELETVRDAHRADELAHSLVPGEACPVCLQEVAVVPKRPRHKGIAEAEDSLAQARSRVSASARGQALAERDQGNAEDEGARLGSELDQVRVKLEDAPPADEAARLLELSKTAQADLTAARKESRIALESQRKTEKALKELETRYTAAGRELGQLRDRFAEQRPPTLTGDHVADWETFMSWARVTNDDVATKLAASSAAAEQAEQVAAQRRGDVLETLASGGIAAPSSLTEVSVSTAVANALTAAQLAVERVQERRSHAARLAGDVAESQQAERLNRELGLLLSARNFERWMVEEALQSMVTEASATLNELSNGQFELTVDAKQDLLVVDHNDASSQRPVQTLSGGETFQASLALALALSSQIAGLSSGGGQLDTILLDEGFGTLDASTLDVVASTLEQLSGGGERTVGLVTHVAALADRVPVRFQVTREGSKSRVEKVWS
ncbi:SMC family ATPase [Nocardioides guangzhouensis]|uniref:Nuclease SbcCD subunit C n=1 Tax=Nocardioides guangzhouensis TaxID=2497878 RepID=A0A4V1XXX1_9ACTN|nr:SMC family ATPase [Nocardioides guangzhouensis]RYP81229.1 SMC family ATPase [Nocardioides guangzhouensis]